MSGAETTEELRECVAVEARVAVHLLEGAHGAAAKHPVQRALVAAADADDLAGAGCGGFSWSGLTAVALDLVGSYTDSWGTTHEIDGDGWEQSGGRSPIIIQCGPS